MLICNYGNGGNIPGKPIFTSGKAGSKCPKGSYNFRGLCRTKRREYENDDLDENNQELEESKEELEEQNESKKQWWRDKHTLMDIVHIFWYLITLFRNKEFNDPCQFVL